MMNFAAAFHHIGINALSPLWSLAVEEQFYFLWPILVLLLSRRSLYLACGVLLVVPLILRAVATPLFRDHFPIYYLTPFRMDLLAAGGLLALALADLPKLLTALRPVFVALMFASMTLLVLLARFAHVSTNANTVFSNVVVYGLCSVIVTSLLALVVTDDGWLRRILSTRVLVYIGTISYSMYLVHLTMQALAEGWFDTHGKLAVAAATYAMTLAYASASWFEFEQRLIRVDISRRRDRSPEGLVPSYADVRTMPLFQNRPDVG
jgi:peptidoglycan/LPS O-acetylase OafA/YrhL